MTHAAAVDALYGAAAAPDRWSETLANLCEHIGATGAFLIHHTADGAGAIQHARLRGDLVRPYFEFFARNPFSETFARLKTEQVYVGSAIVDMAQVRRSAFYADIMAPQAMEEQIVAPVERLTRGGGAGGLSFTFSNARVEHGHQQVSRIARLASHISRAVGLSLDLQTARGGDRRLETMLHAMPTAALLLDRGGGVLAVNARAERLLREGDGLAAIKTDRLRLSAASRWETRAIGMRIAEALAAGGDADNGSGADLRIARPSGRPPLLVSLIPLPPNAFLAFEAEDSGARVLMQILDPAERRTADAERIGALAGLTPAETRVAAVIGGGLGVPQAATALGLSQNTIKTHLNRCFEKLGVRSQAGLVRLLSFSAAGAPRGRR